MNFNHSISKMLVTLGIALLAVQGQTAVAQQQHSLPLVKSAGGTQEAFLRIINRSDSAGEVTIHGTDDSGTRSGPITLSLSANQTKHLNSADLEIGNPDKGLSGGLDDGDGDWRLDLTTDLDIEVLGYVRTSDGFVTSMHDVVQPEYVPVGDYMRYRVWFLNPGTNLNQRSLLRVINVAGIDNEITINALDDAGVSGGEVSFTLGPYEARTIGAEDLEEGDDSLTGSFGNGTGKWQLIVTTESARSAQRRVAHPIQVMSLLQTPTGHLTNLSTIGAGNDFNRGTSGTDWIWGSEGDDILNPGDNDDSYDGTLGSEGDDTIVYSDSGPSAFQWLGYYGLTTGVDATINGETNLGTVRKGASGTDTIVDIANPLNASKEAPYGGFGLGGTAQGDSFDLTLDDGQWMEVRGEAGDDRITIRSGQVRVTYRNTPNSIDVDLAKGRAANDGHGGTDTISGPVFELQGGLGDDIIRGSNGSDRLDGGPGNDMLYPRNNSYREGDDKVIGSFGDDTIDFSDTEEGAWHWIRYDRNIFSEGINVTIDGVSNRATVDKGSAGTDTIIDISAPISLSDGGFGLEGTSFDDVFNLTFREGQWIQVRGEAGHDTFNFSSGHVTGRIDYESSPAGIDIDLARGRADNDGHGDVDTINGAFWEVRGSNHDDVMRGSGRGESFAGLSGDDIIDGRGGRDRVRYDTGGRPITLEADLEAGTAIGVWEDGSAFTHTLVNIEELRGSHGNDVLLGDSRDNWLRGRSGDDEIRGRGGDDHLRGEQGADLFVFERGHGEDYIADFSDGEDLIMFRGLNLNSKDEVLNNAHAWDEGVGVWIDLRPFGGGTLSLGGLPRESFDRSDFVF